MRACLCCSAMTISSVASDYQICSECHWEDDPLAYDNPDYEGGANGVSLNQARRNYAETGYSFGADKPLP